MYVGGKEGGRRVEWERMLGGDARKPAPVFLVPTVFNPKTEKLLGRGYGLAYFNPASVEPDNANGYAKSIRAFFAKLGQTEPGPDEWGAIGAWAWAMSRAMDYLVTDSDIDAHKAAIMGVSRYGTVTMWARAHEERSAIASSCQPLCVGATLVSRHSE